MFLSFIFNRKGQFTKKRHFFPLIEIYALTMIFEVSVFDSKIRERKWGQHPEIDGWIILAEPKALQKFKLLRTRYNEISQK